MNYTDCADSGQSLVNNIAFSTNGQRLIWLKETAVLFRMSYCVYRMSLAEPCGALFDLTD